jgi:hypothetical protein
MLALTAAVVLLGIGLMFYITVQEVDERVNAVRTQIDQSISTLRTDVRRELDARIPPGGVGAIPTPSPTPFPTTTPAPEPTVDGGDVTPEPTIEGETTPDAEVTPTPTEPEIIEP